MKAKAIYLSLAAATAAFFVTPSLSASETSNSATRWDIQTYWFSLAEKAAVAQLTKAHPDYPIEAIKILALKEAQDYKNSLSAAEYNEQLAALQPTEQGAPEEGGSSGGAGIITALAKQWYAKRLQANLAGVGREGGIVAKGIRFGTGISFKDIKEQGLLGGENSEANKAAKAVENAGQWLGKTTGIKL